MARSAHTPTPVGTVNEMPEEPRIDKHTVGGIWEEADWEVQYDRKVDRLYYKHCPHVRKEVCPRVIVMVNEGGYNSTGLCLDCVLEAYGRSQS